MVQYSVEIGEWYSLCVRLMIIDRADENVVNVDKSNQSIMRTAIIDRIISDSEHRLGAASIFEEGGLLGGCQTNE